MRHASIALSLAVLAGCALDGAPDTSTPDGIPVGATGARLTLDYYADTDVVGFHMLVRRVRCAPPNQHLDADGFAPWEQTYNVDLLDGLLPGGLGFLQTHLDPTSKHVAADLFVTLPPGCYNVMATPVAEFRPGGWVPSEDCSSAHRIQIPVRPEQTTEILLVSQCEGDPVGALDALVLLNVPPRIIDVAIDRKFTLQCAPVEVCATYTDPNDNHVELELTAHGDAFLVDLHPPQIVGFDDGARIWERCATLVTEDLGTTRFTLSLYDTVWVGGERVRVEDILNESSSAHLTFPIHTSWHHGGYCVDDEGDLRARPDGIDLWPGCDVTTPDDFYCAPGSGIDPALRALICDGVELDFAAVYPECPEND